MPRTVLSFKKNFVDCIHNAPTNLLYDIVIFQNSLPLSQYIQLLFFLFFYFKLKSSFSQHWERLFVDCCCCWTLSFCIAPIGKSSPNHDQYCIIRFHAFDWLIPFFFYFLKWYSMVFNMLEGKDMYVTDFISKMWDIY